MSDKRKRKKQRSKTRRMQAAENREALRRQRRQAVSRWRRHNHVVATEALARYQTPEQRLARRGLDAHLVEVITRRSRKLVKAEYHDALALVSDSPWLRELDQWRPRGKSPRAHFRALAAHLLVRYAMPDFMYEVFFISSAALREIAVRLFVHLGAGGSLNDAVAQGLLPVPLTRRMCHRFMQSSPSTDFLAAIRHAQVEAFGGDPRLAEAIDATRALGRQLTDDEPFWSTVIQWTCNQSMLAPNQIDPIYDWIAREHAANPAFSMKGRTASSVLRAVESWHGELALERAISGHRYEPSGMADWFHERKVRMPTGAHRHERRCVTEIRTSRALVAEGRAMRHCVYSYSGSIERGHCSIWSYKVDGERILTLEVCHRTKRVVQVRGFANRRPTAGEMTALGPWMADNELTPASYLAAS